jgi:hypothetical protein
VKNYVKEIVLNIIIDITYDEWKAVTTYRLMYRNEKNAFKETQVCKAFKLFILKQKNIL